MGKHYVKKLIHAENQRESLEQEKQKLKGIIDHLEKDLCTAKKQAKNNRSTCDDLHKNKEILKKNILRAAGMILVLTTVRLKISSSECYMRC